MLVCKTILKICFPNGMLTGFTILALQNSKAHEDRTIEIQHSRNC